MIGPFCALFDKLWGLLCIGLLTTEIQWIFSGEEGGWKSSIGEGLPAPLVSLLFTFLAHKGSMYDYLFLASFLRFLGVIGSYYASIFGRISDPFHA